MGRDTVWHELYDRMLNQQCPLCALIKDRTERSMDGFLYESVNDRGVRDAICGSNGLCNFHAYQLMGKGDPLAHALLYGDLLLKAMDSFKSGKRKQTQYPDHDGCVFCLRAKESENIYVDAFADAFCDADFKEQYIQGGLLCVPHLELIGQTKKTGADEMIQETTAKYVRLVNNLSEIKRKNDYRFSQEAWTDEEKTAWKKAVEVINASKGIKK